MPLPTLSQLAQETCQRLEETFPPVFWSLQGEVYPALVWAQNEAAIITGEPEIISTLFTFPSNQTVIVLPADCIALLRIQAPQWIQKTTLWDLDRNTPGWETDIGQTIDGWFPVGLTQFGIHPQLTASVQGYLSYIKLPISTPRPYTGNEIVPFQPEYSDGFADYAASLLPAKEASEEFIQAGKLYDRFLEKMASLSNFSYRKGSLRFTRVVGAPSAVTQKEKT